MIGGCFILFHFICFCLCSRITYLSLSPPYDFGINKHPFSLLLRLFKQQAHHQNCAELIRLLDCLYYCATHCNYLSAQSQVLFTVTWSQWCEYVTMNNLNVLLPSWLSPAISLLKVAKKTQTETLIDWLFKTCQTIQYPHGLCSPHQW